jgi:transposase
MSEHDVLFGYRLQLFDLAARTTVTEACRVFGIHRSTYYSWKRRIERHGLEILRPRERRRPRQLNQLSPLVEERIVAFALGHPGLGPKRIAAELRKERWGGLDVSHNGVWRCLCRHGLNTRAKRLSLVAGYAAPHEPPREPEPERHVEAERPGELVGIDSFYVGRLAGTGRRLAADHDRRRLLLRLGRARHLPARQPDRRADLEAGPACRRRATAAGWQLERVLSDNGGEYRSRSFRSTLDELGTRHTRIRAGRPQTNGAVESLHRTILEERWRPAFARYLHVRFTGLKRDLDRYLDYYHFERAHTGRLTQGRIPAEIVYGARKVKAR